MSLPLKFARRFVGAVLLLALASVSTAQVPVVAPRGENFYISGPGQNEVGGRPAVASDGTDFLVAWRTADTTNVAYARVSGDGEALPETTIATGNGAQVPSVAFGGNQYLMVWAQAGEVRGVRISPTGQLLDAVPLTLTTGADSKDRPVGIAFDGATYLIAWRTSTDAIRGKRFDASVAALDGAAGFGIGQGFYPWVAAGGGTFAVAWHGHGPSGLDIFAARVSPSGVVAEPGGFLVANLPEDQDHVSIAYGGGVFLIVWHDWRNTDSHGNGEAHGARLSPGGTLLDATPLKISDMTLWQVPVQVAFDGTDFFVAWHQDNPSGHRDADVYGRRVSTTGLLLDEKPLPISAAYLNQWAPRLGARPGRILAAWSDLRDVDECGGGCVQGQLLERKLVPQPESGIGGSIASGVPLWTAEASPTGSPLYTVAAASGDEVYAAGEDNVIRRQAGVWQDFHSPVPRMFGLWTGPLTSSGLHHVRAAGWCWKTPHFDGATWEPERCTGPAGSMLAFGIWGEGTDFWMTVGTNGLFGMYTYPGDLGWFGNFGTRASMRDVWGVSRSLIYAVGEFGRVFRYDGGAGVEDVWTPISYVPTLQSLNGIWGSGPNDIFAVGDFGTVVHFDGTKWSVQPTPTLAHLLGVSGAGPNDVYAVGSRGTILHYDGVLWTQQPSGTSAWLFDVATSDWKAWAVGEGGTILYRQLAGGANGDEDGDGIPNAVEVAEGRKPFVRDNDVFADARLFAMQQYRHFLAREGDAGGIAAWSGNIQSGAQTRGQVIESFFSSNEFQGAIAPVARLYFAYFLRIPEYQGINFWIGYYRAGHSLNEISDFFAQSGEFTSRYGSLDNGQFVALVYNNVLGRAPDGPGLAFWKNELDTGARTRGQVMLGFSESAEYRATSDSEIYVTMMYIGMLRRAPDAPGFSFWVKYRDDGNSGLALIDGFLAAAEYRARFLP